MDEIDKTNFSDQTKFRLDDIKKTEDYFNSEINQRKYVAKKMSKYVTIFNYIVKILIVLNAKTGGVWFISHAAVVGTPVGIASAGFTIAFALTTEIIKKLLQTTRVKKKKHHEIIMLAKSKLNSIETLVSQAITDMEISHEQYSTILKEKGKYEKMKENLRNASEELEEKQENMRLNSVNSKEYHNFKTQKVKKWQIKYLKKINLIE